VTICPDSTWENLYRAADDLADAARQKGKHVMQIPVGGSSPLGVEGMRRGALEVPDTPGFHQIVFASSSGSTHAGLLTRFRSTPTRVIGIACDPEAEIGADFAELANGRARLFGEPDDFRAEEFHLDFGYVGTGYGTPSQEGIAAIRWLARTEGIFLDPIYSARAFAAVIDYARQGRLPGRTLFWHTGGVPNLFALPNEVGDTELRNLGR
jgi:1-aminocyclopropane-1-carboxylate deaminase/D-cysteine desulfhydrase-like pyridoxal-dependent ACC family enzyme